MDGILAINKPPGLTSHDVVNRVRRLTGQRRVGHAGTLDPMATGVLLVCLGQATRVAEYLADGGKTYCAEVVLGISTDTYDADGQVTKTAPVAASLGDIEAALAGFTGDIAQVPPAYSAIKQAGEPLYRSARAGQPVAAAPRQVRIHEIRVIAYQPPALVMQVTCGKGTYIRSLAHDLGERLGCGGHLSALVRLRSGRFDLDDTLTLDDLALAAQHGYLGDLLYSPDEALLDTPALILGAERELMLAQGKPLPVQGMAPPSPGSVPDPLPPPASGVCRAYNLDGEFLAVGRLDVASACWQPQKVFVRPAAPAVL